MPKVRRSRLPLPALASLVLIQSPVASSAIATADLLGTGFNQPTFVTAAPGDSQHLFVVERDGNIRVFDRATGSTLPTPFLSVPQILISESGMWGLAFAPDYATSGVFYVAHTSPDFRPVLTRFHVSGADPLQANAASAETIFTAPLGADLHNGGWIGFHPTNGSLYMTLGDKDGLTPDSGFPHVGHAQNPDFLRGKILRFKVGSTGPYTIPSDNPFVGGGALPEIWALGVRNPWRASFDRLTGDFYFGDVGNNAREEINRETADFEGGRNYGWSTLEGTLTTGFHESLPSLPDPSDPSLVPPLFEYPHTSDWGSSITGGYVYRGSDIPDLQGAYVFGDYITGRVWTLTHDNGSDVAVGELLLDFPEGGELSHVSSFGEDNSGNLLVLDFVDGELYQLASSSEPIPEGRTAWAGLVLLGIGILRSTPVYISGLKRSPRHRRQH